MKYRGIALLGFLGFYLVSCTKGTVHGISGTINGKSALTLYGTSHKSADYFLLSTDSTNKQLVYSGITFDYYAVPNSNNIVITLSSTQYLKATLTKTGSKTVLYLDTLLVKVFESREYDSD